MKLRTSKDLLKAFIADIEAMEINPPFDIEHDGVEEQKKYWYGGFDDFSVQDDDLLRFQWVNLGILVEEAKKICAK